MFSNVPIIVSKRNKKDQEINHSSNNYKLQLNNQRNLQAIALSLDRFFLSVPAGYRNESLVPLVGSKRILSKKDDSISISIFH